MFDHVIICKEDVKECRITRVMRSADYSSDYRKQRTVLKVRIKPLIHKKSLNLRITELCSVFAETDSFRPRKKFRTRLVLPLVGHGFQRQLRLEKLKAKTEFETTAL